MHCGKSAQTAFLSPVVPRKADHFQLFFTSSFMCDRCNSLIIFVPLHPQLLIPPSSFVPPSNRDFERAPTRIIFRSPDVRWSPAFHLFTVAILHNISRERLGVRRPNPFRRRRIQTTKPKIVSMLIGSTCSLKVSLKIWGNGFLVINVLFIWVQNDRQK